MFLWTQPFFVWPSVNINLTIFQRYYSSCNAWLKILWYSLSPMPRFTVAASVALINVPGWRATQTNRFCSGHPPFSLQNWVPDFQAPAPKNLVSSKKTNGIPKEAVGTKKTRDSTITRCEGCGKVYNYRSSYYCHRKYECGKDPQFVCPYCPHRTKRKVNLKTHVRMMHPTMPLYD